MASRMKMYNAGDRIKEPISFSVPDTYGDIHAIARWEMDAPAQSFFHVPTELRLGQGEKVSVQFPYDIVRKFGSRGVILIDEEEYAGKEIEEDQPFAATDDEAVEKGKALWRAYLTEIVRNHLDACAEARAKGGAPRPAQGFTKRALKLLNQIDPGEHVFQEQVQVATSNNPDAVAMRAQVDALAKMMEELKQQNQKLMADLKAKSMLATDALIPAAKSEDKPKAGK